MRAALLASLLRRPPALRSRSLAPRTRRLGTEAAAASSAAAGGTGPVALTVQGFAAFQLHTGLPWWAAIGGSAVALRVMLLPALWYQLRETRRFVALRPRFAVLRAEAASIADPSARASAYLRGVWRTARAANVQPLVVVGMPLLQIPLLILAVVASRRLVLDKDSPHAPALRTGGTAWFRDLTSPDATKLLPLAAVALVVANIQLAFHASRSPLWSMLRDVVQVGAVVGFPFYTLLPAGVFMYWVPNSLWSLAPQPVETRRPSSRRRRSPLAPLAAGAARPQHRGRRATFLAPSGSRAAVRPRRAPTSPRSPRRHRARSSGARPPAAGCAA